MGELDASIAVGGGRGILQRLRDFCPSVEAMTWGNWSSGATAGSLVFKATRQRPIARGPSSQRASAILAHPVARAVHMDPLSRRPRVQIWSSPTRASG